MRSPNWVIALLKITASLRGNSTLRKMAMVKHIGTFAAVLIATSAAAAPAAKNPAPAVYVNGAVAVVASTAPIAEKSLSIVLVHGALADGSGWEGVYNILTKDGYEVIVVQNSTATLDGDVATTTRAITLARHPVVLVGHSYGGVVITEAGNNPKVRALAYVAAYEPDAGESVETLNAKHYPGAAEVPFLPPQDGFLMLNIQKFPTSFAADVDVTKTRFMAASQVPFGLTAITTKVVTPAWKTKPTFAIITTNDHMIPTAQQREMVARSHAKAIDVVSSHAVMLSQPATVATFIESAAEVSK
jgi:pimeloyl-ACP methyl ester carboxylesterase